MIQLVQEFHRKFGLPAGEHDVLSGDKDLQSFRLKFLIEEVAELDAALMNRNRVDAFDALLDLAYVTYGTALNMGITPEQWMAGMLLVHEANMKKVRVESAGESKRGHASDVRKPEGWTGPEEGLAKVLQWQK
jgi:predicted HAD superfamily Cof-like phosphohydrolase